MVDGGRVIIRSKPFIARELGGCGDPPMGLKFTRAMGGHSLGRSDGGISVYTPPPISPSIYFLWGKNYVKTAIGHEY